MRARAGILAAVLTASALTSLAACGSDAKPSSSPTGDSTRLPSPTAPVTEAATLDCGKFNGVALKIAQAQAKIYTAGKDDIQNEVDALNAGLAELKDGAPSDVVTAIDDLSDAFDKVAGLRANPADTSAQAELATAGKRLGEDGQKITAYIVSKCKS